MPVAAQVEVWRLIHSTRVAIVRHLDAAFRVNVGVLPTRPA